MTDKHILRTIFESTRATTAQFRVNGPFSIYEATPAIGKINDWTMKQVETKIKSFIGKFNDQLQLRHVEPHAYERGFRAGENNSPLTTNVMVNFNKLGTEQKRLAFCAGWAAVFNNADTLKESACPACDDELEEEVVTVYEEDGIARGGKKVVLNRPFRTPGAKKKFAVYVRNDKGAVLRVSFGDPKMEIKRDNPEKRKSYRARHGCSDPGPKWKANYWSCRMWGRKNVGNIVKEDSQLELPFDKREVVELDTIFGPTAQDLRSRPMKWSVFLNNVKQGKYEIGVDSKNFNKPKILPFTPDYKPSKGPEEIISYIESDQGFTQVYEPNNANAQAANKDKVEAVVVDQFSGPTPYTLQKQPIKWEQFIKDVKDGEYDRYNGRAAEIIHADKSYRPAWGTTVYKKDPNGNVQVWLSNWDSSD